MKKWIVHLVAAGTLLAPMTAAPAWAVDEQVQVQLLKQLFRTEQSEWLRILTENSRSLDQSFFERCDARIRWAMENSQTDDAVRFAFVADLGSKATGKRGRFRINLAQFFQKRGNDLMYKDLIDNILLLDPTDQEALFCRAGTFAAAADLGAAYDQFKALYEQGYQRDACLTQMGKISLLQQKEDQAEKEWKQALAINSSNREAKAFLDELEKTKPKIVPEGFSRIAPPPVRNPQAAPSPAVMRLIDDADKAYRAQDLAGAEGGYTRALQSDPNNVKAHVNLGALYYRMNNLTNAIVHLDQATKIDPRDRDAWHYLGNCYERRFDSKGSKDDLDKAYNAYQQGLQLVPQDRPLQLELDRVRGKKSGTATR